MRRPHKGFDTFQNLCGEFLNIVNHETSLNFFRLGPHAGERACVDSKVDKHNIQRKGALSVSWLTIIEIWVAPRCGALEERG